MTMLEETITAENRADTLIQVGDRMGYVTATGAAPTVGDKIEIDGERYSLVEVSPVAPGPTVVMYKLIARR